MLPSLFAATGHALHGIKTVTGPPKTTHERR
jgi:hypothetical protein